MSRTARMALEKPQGSTAWSAGRIALVCLALLLFLGVALRTAWLCDDAFIMLRTVDNFVHGYGLRWNVEERVQSFTCPLWTLLLSCVYFVTREPYYTTLALSLALSLAAVGLTLWRAASRVMLLFAAAALAGSKAFTDFSTSGLENPLTHALLALFFCLYLSPKPPSPRRLLWLALCAALIAVNRLDALLLVAPALAEAFLAIGSWRTGLKMIALGMTPLVLWESFSLIYYGFPFPNTAYAKLNNAIAWRELALGGLRYFADTTRADYVTLPVMALAVVVAFIHRQRRFAIIATGMALYLIYVVKIGGDFMIGRFLSSPFLLAVILIVAAVKAQSRASAVTWLLVCGAVLAASLVNAKSPMRSGSEYGADANWGKHIQGAVDERAFYYGATGLFSATRGHADQTAFGTWKATGEDLRNEAAKEGGPICAKVATVGICGFTAGPNVYLVDRLALCDPLLARIRPAPVKQWRIGHFTRPLPDGYFDTIVSGTNQIRDPELADYYTKLCLITRGDLFSGERLSTIIDMNLGNYDHLLESIDRTISKMPPREH